MRRDQPTRPTQIKGGGYAQDIARERQQGPPHKRIRTPPRRSEGWNELVTPTGPPTEEQTRDGVGPLKGKDQVEGLELSQTRVRSEGHSKHACTPRVPRESSGKGRSLTRRRILQTQKTTC